MTNEKAISIIKNAFSWYEDNARESEEEDWSGQHEALRMAIKALEPKPMEKFDDVKTHIQRLAGDYKCWDNRLTWEEALELNRMLEAQPCEDCISRQAVIILIDEASEMHPYKVVGDSDTYSNYNQGWSDACDWLYANIEGVPSVTPKYSDEEIDKIQEVEQAYVDKMVELAVEESKQKWLNSFDTSSATKCYEAVNIMKERLEHEET